MYEKPSIRLPLRKETLRRIEPVIDEAGKSRDWIPTTTISTRPNCPTTNWPTDP